LRNQSNVLHSTFKAQPFCTKPKHLTLNKFYNKSCQNALKVWVFSFVLLHLVYIQSEKWPNQDTWHTGWILFIYALLKIIFFFFLILFSLSLSWSLKILRVKKYIISAKLIKLKPMQRPTVPPKFAKNKIIHFHLTR
jgi:hypothetical protein